MLAIRSIGIRFQEEALRFETPLTPDRTWLSIPPSPLTSIPSLMRCSFDAGIPASSNAYVAN